METIFVIFVASGIFLCTLLWHAFLGRMKKGKFAVLERSPQRAVLQTNFGTFTIDGNNHRVDWITPKNTSHTCSWNDFKGISYTYNEEDGLLTEYLFSDFGVTDLFSEYRDTHQTFAICLIKNEPLQSTQTAPAEKTKGKKDDRKIPLFIVSQYEERDFFPIIPAILQAIGWKKDAAEHSRKILDEIRRIFAEMGQPLEMLS